MKTLVFAFIALIGCAPASAAVVTPTPQVVYLPATPAPTTAPHVFDPHNFSANVYVGSDAKAATKLIAELPAAWAAATGGRSVVRFVGADPEVYIYFGDELPAPVSGGTQRAWFFFVPSLRFIYIHEGVTDVLATVHELGHVLGAPHWTDCAAPPVEIMCAIQGSATTFSERELRAMGL